LFFFFFRLLLDTLLSLFAIFLRFLLIFHTIFFSLLFSFSFFFFLSPFLSFIDFSLAVAATPLRRHASRH